MDIKICKLSRNMAEDYIHYFDNRAFSDGSKEKGCYCVWHHWTDKHEHERSLMPENERQYCKRNYARELIQNGILNGFAAFDDIRHISNELKDYTEVHFASEEAYMRSINYSGYDAQKRAHDAFISRLQEIDLNLVEEDPRKYMESLIEFLLGWLINHILHVDKQIPNKG